MRPFQRANQSSRHTLSTGRLPVSSHCSRNGARGPFQLLVLLCLFSVSFAWQSGNVHLSKQVSRIPLTLHAETTQRKPHPRKRQHNKKKHNNYRDDGNRQFNQKLVQSGSADDLLDLIASHNRCLAQPQAGGSLNSINFSTALHRLARHSSFASRESASVRASILSNPRFALLLASTGEALYGDTIPFGGREICNMAWALAKLQIAPPLSVMPRADDNSRDALEQVSTQVRQAVLQVAVDRREGRSESDATAWIPLLSQLAGHLVDYLQQFAAIKVEKEQFLQMQEMSNMMWASATANRANDQVFATIADRMMIQQRELLENKPEEECLKPQEWSNTVWAIAKSGISMDASVYVYIADLVTHSEFFSQAFKPQEWSNLMWGTATSVSSMARARNEVQQQDVDFPVLEKAALDIMRAGCRFIISRRAEWFKTQELSNSAWSMATVGFGISETEKAVNNRNNYVILSTDDHDGDMALKDETMELILNASVELKQRFRAQEINNFAWSVSRLTDLDDAQNVTDRVADIVMELRKRRHPRLTSQDIGTTVWAMATLRYTDATLYREVAKCMSVQKAHQYRPQEISMTIWAFATAEIELGEDVDAFDTTLLPRKQPRISDPIVKAFAIAAQEIIRRPKEFKPQELKDAMWSFSKIGIRHPRLFKFVANFLTKQEGKMDAYMTQAVGNIAWSYARQAQLYFAASQRHAAVVGAQNGKLAAYKAIFCDVGEGLLHELFHTLADTSMRVHDNMKDGTAQDITNTVWAFATLGLKHETFLNAMTDQFSSRLLSCVEDSTSTRILGQEVANFAWALAMLTFTSSNLLTAVSDYIATMNQRSKGMFCTKQEIANVAWACAVFDQYPSTLMDAIYDVLLGDGAQEQGLQFEGVVTLLYLQAALHRSEKQRILPPDFPEAWRENEPSSLAIQENSELTIQVSKTQQAVSKSLSRIGFEFVEEHTIAMNDLHNEYNVEIPPKQVEVFSIDCANLESKIAIEVDGPPHFVTNIEELPEVRGYSKVVAGTSEYQFDWDGSSQEENGPTVLKTRLLTSLGWTMVRIPYWEWQALTTNEERDEYCRGRLQDIQ